MEPKTNVACDHAQFFAQQDGRLTDQSMTDAHTKQGINSGVYVKVWAIDNILYDRNLDKTAQCLSSICNPASSGIWDENGFNEKRFAEVTQNCAKKSDGTLVMTESIFKQFIHNLHAGENLGNATHLSYLIPVPWTAVTDGSVGELFKYYSDTTLEGENGKSENAMTLGKFRQFYTDPNSVMQERIKNQVECESTMSSI